MSSISSSNIISFSSIVVIIVAIKATIIKITVKMKTIVFRPILPSIINIVKTK